MQTPSPLPELLVDESVGESLAADPDALQHTVTAQLVEHKVGVDQSRLLELVGNDAADEVGDGVPQGRHEVPEGGLVELSHGGELTPLLPLGVLVRRPLEVRPQSSNEGLR